MVGVMNVISRHFINTFTFIYKSKIGYFHYSTVHYLYHQCCFGILKLKLNHHFTKKIK